MVPPRPRRARERSVAGEITASFRVMVLGAAVMAALTLGMLAWFHWESQPEVAQVDALVSAVEDAHGGLVDQETGLRAYVATGDSAFLQPYDTGLGAASAADRVISRLTVGPRLTEDVLAFRLSQQDWTRQWATKAGLPGTRQLLLSGTPAADAAALATFFASGKALMDSYRSTERTLLADARAQLAREHTQEQRVLLGSGAGLTLIAAALAGMALVRRRTLRRQVAGPLAQLLATVRDVSRGELNGPPALAGSSDVVALRDGLAEMTKALAEQRAQGSARRAAAARSTQRLHQVLAFAREISGTLSLRYALDALTDAAAALTAADAVRVWLLPADGGDLQLAHDSRLPRKRQPPQLTCPLGAGTVGRAALEPHICRSYDQEAGATEGVDGDIIALQLTVGARVIGVLELRTPTADDLEEALTLVETVAGHAATAVEAARLYEQAQTLSLSDALTGLANRRQLDEDLRLEVDRALRYGRPLALIMIDLDHFKALNDRFGHPAGDAVLQQVATVLRDTVRGCDSVYRYGGEEIAVLARDTDLTGAGMLADRLRVAVEAGFAARTDGLVVTLSAGAAAVPEHAASPTTLVAAADHALYAAKALGRNRVAMAPRGG